MTKSNTDVRTSAADYEACVAACQQTLAYCIEKGGALADPTHLRAMLDCIDMCRTTAALLLRGSPQFKRLCGTCSDVCRTCLASCEKLAATGDEQLRYCADVCRRCTDSCSRLAA